MGEEGMGFNLVGDLRDAVSGNLWKLAFQTYGDYTSLFDKALDVVDAEVGDANSTNLGIRQLRAVVFIVLWADL